MSLKSQIQKLQKDYAHAVCEIAEREFENVVKPWLIKKGFRFVSGMGGWAIYRNDEYISRDDLPAYITDILELEVLGGHELAEYLGDFDPDD